MPRMVPWFGKWVVFGVAVMSPLLASYADTTRPLEVLESNQECKDFDLQEAREQYQAAFSSQRQVTKKIRGVKLTGTDEELAIARRMAGPLVPESWKRNEGKCDTVLCALAVALGSEESALRALTFAKRTGYVFSLETAFGVMTAKDLYAPAEKVAVAWYPWQIREIDRTFGRLPSHFFFLPSLKEFHSSQVGDTLPRPIPNSVFALAEIGDIFYFWASSGQIVFTGKSAQVPVAFSRIAVHELAHHYDMSRNWPRRPELGGGKAFEKLSGWKFGKAKYPCNFENPNGPMCTYETEVASHSTEFVTPYSRTKRAEDFAETVAYSFVEPEIAQRNAPSKYRYVVENILGPAHRSESPLNAVIASFDPSWLLTECLSRIDSLSWLNGEKAHFTIRERVFDNQVYEYIARDWTDAPLCLGHVALQVLRENNSNNAACAQGGLLEITRLINRRIQPHLQELLESLLAFSSGKSPSPETGNSRYLEFLDQNHSRFSHLAGLDSATKLGISHMLAKAWKR